MLSSSFLGCNFAGDVFFGKINGPSSNHMLIERNFLLYFPPDILFKSKNTRMKLLFFGGGAGG